MTRTFSSDGQALELLGRTGYVVENGVITPPRDTFDRKKYREPTCSESDAITYLCNEWDYSYVG